MTVSLTAAQYAFLAHRPGGLVQPDLALWGLARVPCQIPTAATGYHFTITEPWRVATLCDGLTRWARGLDAHHPAATLARRLAGAR